MASNQWTSDLDKKEMEIRRIRAVQSVNDGKAANIVAEEIGVSKAALSQWMKMYKEKGWKGLLISNDYNTEGILTDEDIKNLKEIMAHKPTHWGYESDLWTSNMVRDVLAEKFNKSVSQATILVALKKTGIPIKSPRLGRSKGTWRKTEPGGK